MAKLLSDGLSNTVVAIVFMAIDTVAVILRILSKQRTQHRFGPDDAWIFFALASFFVWSGLVIHCKLNWVARLRIRRLIRYSAACFLQGSIDPIYLYFSHIAPDDATEVFKVIPSSRTKGQ